MKRSSRKNVSSTYWNFKAKVDAEWDIEAAKLRFISDSEKDDFIYFILFYLIN